jgi:hypothetical protein
LTLETGNLTHIAHREGCPAAAGPPDGEAAVPPRGSIRLSPSLLYFKTPIIPRFFDRINRIFRIVVSW